MKTTFIFWSVYLTLFYSQLALGQWQQLKPPYKVSLGTICRLGDEQLLVGGMQGAILLTMDGGVYWDSLHSGTRQNILSLFKTENFCYALAGTDTLMYCATDKITTNPLWIKRKLPGKGGQDLYFFDNYLGFICGKGRGEILKTRDGGQTWEQIQTNQPELVLHTIHFVSPETGFALSQQFEQQSRQVSGQILKTIDGGHHWEVIYTDSGLFYNDLHFINEQEGFAVGYKGSILRTTDGGISWRQQQTGTSENLLAIDFTHPQIGNVIGTMGTLLTTQDKGNNWKALDTGNNYLFAGISFLDSNKGFLLVDGNLLLKTTSGGL